MKELIKELETYKLQTVHVWINNERVETIPQSDYINLCEAIAFCEEAYKKGVNETIEDAYSLIENYHSTKDADFIKQQLLKLGEG